MNYLPASIEEALQTILPPKPNSDSRYIEDKRVLEALYYQAKTGCVWRDMPECFPSNPTVFRRRKLWIEAGVFDQLLEASLGWDAKEQNVDATFIECKAPLEQRGWTKIGNGLKIQVLCRKDGAITALQVSSASPHESKLLVDLLEEIPQLPKRLLGDSAYDTPDLREYLEGRACELITTAYWGAHKNKPPLTAKMKRAKKRRWVIERTFGWLKSFLGAATCRCRSLSTYWVALAFGVATLNGWRINL